MWLPGVRNVKRAHTRLSSTSSRKMEEDPVKGSDGDPKGFSGSARPCSRSSTMPFAVAALLMAAQAWSRSNDANDAVDKLAATSRTG